MSNFSNIGFNVAGDEAFEQLLDNAYQKSKAIKVKEGVYSVYTDASGAALFIQLDHSNVCIGANPHFKGKSKRTVCLTNTIESTQSVLDGSFHCWAAPSEENNPDSGEYPFVFEVPDFRTIGSINFPKNFPIQLTAFAQELSVYENEEAYDNSQASEIKFAAQSFIPTGLYSSGEDDNQDQSQAFGMFTGTIKEYELKKNQLTNQEFYWLLVDTLGGEIDVVADSIFFKTAPVINGIVHGQFWLSGQLIHEPPTTILKEKKSFLQKILGR